MSGCGHPNHGAADHDCTPFVPTPRCANCGGLIHASNFYNGPGWTHEHGSSQCRIFARAPEGTPFPPYYAAFAVPPVRPVDGGNP